MSGLLGISSSTLPQFFKCCLICGKQKRRIDPQFSWIGKEMISEKGKIAAKWIHDYIGLDVNQAVLCSSCYGELEKITESAKSLERICMKNLRTMAVTTGAAKCDHTYSARVHVTQKFYDVVLPNRLAKYMTADYDEALEGDIELDAPDDVSDSEETVVQEKPLTLERTQSSTTPDDLDAHMTSHNADEAVTRGKDNLQTSAEQVQKPNRSFQPVIQGLFQNNSISGPMTRKRSAAMQKFQQILPKRTHVLRNALLAIPGPVPDTPATADQPSQQQQQQPQQQEEKKKAPEPTIYKCKMCDLQFTSSLYFSRHQETHDQYYCVKVADQIVPIKTTNTKVVGKERTEQPFQCKICGQEFDCQDDAFEHMKSAHTKKITYKCKICDRKLASKASIRLHLLNHSANKAFTCPHCNKKFGYKSGYNRHLKTHHGPTNLCQLCGKLFASKDTLGRHTAAVHTKTLVKSHVCDWCGKRFDRLSKLKAHNTTHTKERSHLCDICGKTFKHEHLLKNHRNLNNCSAKIEKELKRANQLIQLTRPIRRIRVSKAHACSACPQKFATLPQLADHVTLAHEKECILCGVAIYSGKALKAHKAVCQLGKMSHSGLNQEQAADSQEVQETVAEADEQQGEGEDQIDGSGNSSPRIETEGSQTEKVNKPNPACTTSTTVPCSETSVKHAVPEYRPEDVTDSAVETLLFALSEGGSSAVPKLSTKPSLLPDVDASLENRQVSSGNKDIYIDIAELHDTNSATSTTASVVTNPGLAQNYNFPPVGGTQVQLEDGTVVVVLEEGAVLPHADANFTETLGTVYQTLNDVSPSYMNKILDQ